MAGRRSSTNGSAVQAETTGCGIVPPDKVVIFGLAGQTWALPIDRVQEIQQIVAFTTVPDASSAVLGMLNLRGTIIPALELRRLVGLPVVEHTTDTPMIICHSRDGMVALVVDGVEDVVDVPEGCIQPASPLHSLASRMIGVCRFEQGMVFLLDIDSILELVELPETGGEDVGAV